MLGLFCPQGFAPDVWAIDFAALRRAGYEGLLFDVDNTLVPHGADPTPETDALFAELDRLGFRCLILSDNGPDRLRRFLKNVDADFIDNAGKPRKRGYREALRRLGLPPQKVVMIGDQVFTDVLGANRCRIPSILVRYIGWDPDADPGKRRRAEAWILKHTAHKPARHRLDGFIREEARADGQAAQAVL